MRLSLTSTAAYNTVSSIAPKFSLIAHLIAVLQSVLRRASATNSRDIPVMAALEFTYCFNYRNNVLLKIIEELI